MGPIGISASRNSSERSKRPGFLTTHRVPLSARGETGYGSAGLPTPNLCSDPAGGTIGASAGKESYSVAIVRASYTHVTREPSSIPPIMQRQGDKKQPVGGVVKSQLTEPLDPPSRRELNTKLGDCGKKRLGEDDQHPAESLDRMEADNITAGLAFWQDTTTNRLFF